MQINQINEIFHPIVTNREIILYLLYGFQEPSRWVILFSFNEELGATANQKIKLANKINAFTYSNIKFVE